MLLNHNKIDPCENLDEILIFTTSFKRFKTKKGKTQGIALNEYASQTTFDYQLYELKIQFKLERKQIYLQVVDLHLFSEYIMKYRVLRRRQKNIFILGIPSYWIRLISKRAPYHFAARKHTLTISC